MSKSSGNFFASLLEFILSLFKPKPAPAPAPVPPPPVPPPAPTIPPDNANEPAFPTVSKVALIVYDPTMEDGQKLSKRMNWHSTEELAAGFMEDIQQTSRGLAHYEIVQRETVDEFPVKVDGFRYTPQGYLDVLRNAAAPHQPQEADYAAILARFDILNKVSRGEIDEVWIFAFPHAGFYESTMGGAGAFWCNAPPLKNTAQCARRFVVMGFSYERLVGEMLESFGHRVESILSKTFEKTTGEANLWSRFIRYDKIAPGKAACGNIHFAPNSERDYDWNNARPVSSECYDWLDNFPNFKGDLRTVSAAEWGSGEIRAHHKWWLNHMPRVSGRKNGISHNWWQYIVDPGRVTV